MTLLPLALLVVGLACSDKDDGDEEDDGSGGGWDLGTDDTGTSGDGGSGTDGGSGDGGSADGRSGDGGSGDGGSGDGGSGDGGSGDGGCGDGGSGDGGSTVPFVGWGGSTVSLADSDTKLIGEDAGDGIGGDVFGAGDVDGDGTPDFVVPARGNDEYAEAAGKVYLVSGAELSGAATASIGSVEVAFHGEEAGAILAGSTAALGDVDGDGRSDLVMVSHRHDAAGTDFGEAHVWLASSIATGTTDVGEADYAFTGGSELEFSEHGFAGVGDVDGDRLADLLIGASGNDDVAENADAVYLVFASSLAEPDGGPLADADLHLLCEAADDLAGTTAGSAGDVDGDGLSHVAIGALGSDDGGNAAGKAVVFLADSLGRTGAVSLDDADASLTGEAANDQAAYCVAGLPDLDGDGRSDLLVGASNNDRGGTDAGAAYVVYGNSRTASSGSRSLGTADIVLVGEDGDDYCGRIVASAGDVDGDGRTDLLVSARGDATAGDNAGAALVFLAASLAEGTVDASEAEARFLGEGPNDMAGASLAGPGDLDGDGLDDLLVGANGDDDAGSDAGAVYVLLTP